MPRLSDSMVEGIIVSWLSSDGDEIKVGDEIAEIETDKAIMPYQAELAGPLTILAQAGDTISVGAVIGYIGEPDPLDEPAAAPAGAAATPARAGASNGAPVTTATVGTSNGRVKASPVAKRVAAALGIDLSTLTGSGPGGRIVKRDVEGVTVTAERAPAAAGMATGASPGAAPGAADRGRIERQPLTPTRATIARRMVEAKQGAPEFTVTVTVDVEELLALRARLAELEPEQRLSPGDFVIKACALALREHPGVNASWAGDTVELFSRVNIGVAVAAPGALLVPTLYDADVKSLGQIGAETRALAQSARAGRLAPAEMANATFTVSNLGMYGVSHFTAVLNPPQAAILAVGAAEQQVVVRDGEFVARHRMSLTLTADHRVIYGADAAAFLTSVRERLEQPLKLVL